MRIFKKRKDKMINWQTLDSKEQLKTIIEKSKHRPCAIFKHSTRCPVSYRAKQALENEWDLTEDKIEIYYLDLIANKKLSQKIADTFKVAHQSPQILVIKGGRTIYDASHFNISVAEIKAVLSE
ncbi:MAG: bacillithiol system redox-active protein YtxJ [bacterium]